MNAWTSPEDAARRRFAAESRVAGVRDWSSSCSCGHFSPEAIQTGPHGAVHHDVPDPHRESAEHVGIDLGGQLGTPAGLLLDLLPDPADRLVVELDRAGDRNRKQPVLLGPEAVELSPDAEHDRHAVPFGEHLEETDEPLVGPRDQPRYGVLLLLGAEVRREEEDLEVPVLVERVGELPELLVDLVERVVLLRNLEERARVDLRDLLHQPAEPPFVRPPSPGARAEKSNSSSVSSIRRLWSSPVSVFRATFSVARTVRSATSLRIWSIARLVSLSISRRVRSMSSSRVFAASDFASSSRRSAARRARLTMSSDCSRASRSRSRYSLRIWSASARVRSAASMDSSIARLRRSRASAIRGKASLRRMNRVIANAISVQIISPTLGVTRKLPPPPPPLLLLDPPLELPPEACARTTSADVANPGISRRRGSRRSGRR